MKQIEKKKEGKKKSNINFDELNKDIKKKNRALKDNRTVHKNESYES